MKRSILKNPKQEKQVSTKLGVKEGWVTQRWKKRLVKFYRTQIPSKVPIENQIWLTNPQEIVDFYERLKDPIEDFSNLEYICLLESLADVYDIIDFFSKLREKTNLFAKIIYCNYNWLWSPMFAISGAIGFSRHRDPSNFYRKADIDCFMEMAGWENIKTYRKYLLPVKLPVIGSFFDSFLIKLPLLRVFSLIDVFIARKTAEFQSQKDYTVTVLIPCKNEEDNVEAVIRRTPNFSSGIEFLFINDRSTDRTEEIISNIQKSEPDKNIILIQGQGKGKGEAIREGMKYATGDICMILDADLTVIPEDLPQFYEPMRSRRADFIHGTRLVYPQEEEAMRFANILGNVGFSILFTYILDQRTTDTLCGTKVYWRKDWHIFEEMKQVLDDSDVWGDYNLIFGAARYGLKISQLPVRYFERVGGVSKMTKRFRNGLIMLKVAWHALWQVKFISE
jgi:hypothetical protein